MTSNLEFWHLETADAATDLLSFKLKPSRPASAMAEPLKLLRRIESSEP